MLNTKAHIDNNGRILIPAKIRNSCNIKPGDKFNVEIIDGEIHLKSISKSIQEVQQLFRKYVPKGTNVVDDFLNERQKEYQLESKKMEKWNKN